jgi:DNA-binding CsgD family transcriptional regulator
MSSVFQFATPYADLESCAFEETSAAISRIALAQCETVSEQPSLGSRESAAQRRFALGEPGEGGVRAEAGTDLSVSMHELMRVMGWSRVVGTFSGWRYRVEIHRSSAARGPERLTSREFQVCCLAAQGRSSKQIGESLSIAAATARGALDKSLEKLGLTRSVQLPLLWRTLLGRCERWRDGELEVLAFEVDLEQVAEGAFTLVERELLFELILGRPNRDIGLARGISSRTVANHVAVLFKRLGASSRTDLVAAFLRTR